MAQIHPTAVVERGAEIADDVSIGPYTIVGPHVRIGKGSKIGAHSVLEGHTILGEENRIGHFASLGGAPQDMKYRGEPTKLVIGDRNTIREFTTLHVGTVQDEGVTRIGDDNWIMAYVHIAHDCQVGSNTIFSSNAQIAGHVQVHDWAIVGAMSGVHQYVRIGAHAMLGGASALVQDIPPFVLAAGDKAVPHGINVEGLKRRGFSPDALSALRQAYKLLYKNGLTFEEAKVELANLASAGEAHDVHVATFQEFIASSTRGVIR